MLLNCRNINKKNPQGKRKPSRPKITGTRELQDEISSFSASSLAKSKLDWRQLENIMKACILHVVSLVFIVQVKQTRSRAAMPLVAERERGQ